MTTDDLLLSPACELATQIRAGALSPVDLVERTLARIRCVNPRLNAFCAVYEEDARQQARAAEQALANGATLGPLHGLPVAIKDFTSIRGKVTTRGSHVFADWVPDEQPVIVERLLAAGAIIVGKTTTPEFAYSSFTESPLWGVTRNPWNATRTPGGSSGGAAVAVATGCAALAEGSDMGGSVRIPAACCGVVGLKPSLGRIPFDILPTVFDSISHFGPLARTVDDAALFLSVTEGPDDRDIQSLPPRADRPTPPVARNVAGLRLALSLDLGYYRVDPEIEANTRRAAYALAERGAIVEEVGLAWSRAINDAWFRYWGVLLATAFGDVVRDHRAVMDPHLVALIEGAAAIDAVAFKKIEILRTAMWRDLAGLFRRYDALLCPTTALPAPAVGMTDSDFEETDGGGLYGGFDMTCPFNFVSQCPAISVPSGFTRDGLPTGLQIVGRRFDEATVLRIGAALKRMPLPPLAAGHRPRQRLDGST